MSEYCESRPFCDDRIDELREAMVAAASLTAEVAEWKAAASTEANLRREFLARAETAEAERNIARDEVERLRGVIEDAIETLEAMDLHVDNPLYERMCAALQSSEDGK